MGSSVNISYQGIGDMLKSAEIQAEVERRAGRVRDMAEATAPYDPASATHFKDAFSVEPRPRHDRACAAVVNDDDAAWQIELGTSDTPAHRTLTRALDAAGNG
jgi:hypothetical protein